MPTDAGSSIPFHLLITNDFDWSDTENNRLLFEMTSKYGTPYFSNYINSDMQPSDVQHVLPSPNGPEGAAQEDGRFLWRR